MERMTAPPRQAARPGAAPASVKVAGPGQTRLTQLSEALNSRTSAVGVGPDSSGLPSGLRAGVEALSGISLGGVRVHRNSSRPAQLNAAAYAQGRHIHLGPGQERHLPHEAWHVVQQAQGRVRPTRQMKAGPAINDQTALEREADVMGAAAARLGAGHGGRDGPLPPPARSGNAGALQRKIEYVGYDGSHIDVIRPKLEKYALDHKLPAIDRLARGVISLRESPIDYGEIDLDDPQHVALLYSYITKQETRHAGAARKPEKAPIESQEAAAAVADRLWAQTHSTFPGRVFKVAFLGAGASVAYALQTLGPNANPQDTVVIGPEQPWRHDRGPGVVAHPEHMVTPLRQRAGLTAVDDVFVDRGRFSDTINTAIVERQVRRIREPVTEFVRTPYFHNYYRIWVRNHDKPFYAQKVVVGLGVGGHAPRGVVPENQIARTPDQVGPRRVMDMDLWAHVAATLAKRSDGSLFDSELAHNPREINVILSGGNGGIDVAFDALNRGYKVYWVVGNTGPKFLPGFFNYAAYLAYLRSLRDNQLKRAGIAHRKAEIAKAQRLMPGLYASQVGRNANVMFDGVVGRFLNGATRFQGVYFGRTSQATVTPTHVQLAAMDGSGGPIVGDVLVYAQGQDNKTFKLLDGFFKDLVPKTDIDRRFGDEGNTTLGLQSPDGTLEVIGATAYRRAAEVGPTREQVDHAYAELSKWRTSAAKVSSGHRRDGLDYGKFSAVWNRYLEYRAVFGKPAAEDALKAFNAAVVEYDKYLDTINIDPRQPEEAEVLKGFGAALALARNKAQGPMSPVIASLPQNVLINDQLTPTRSQVEASSGFVPRDIGKHANFITDDRTALAVHISAVYPAIADKRGFRTLIDDIIKSRTEPVASGPGFQAIPPHQAEFQRYWIEHLQMVQRVWK
jgi:hypothetical protein